MRNLWAFGAALRPHRALFNAPPACCPVRRPPSIRPPCGQAFSRWFRSRKKHLSLFQSSELLEVQELRAGRSHDPSPKTCPKGARRGTSSFRLGDSPGSAPSQYASTSAAVHVPKPTRPGCGGTQKQPWSLVVRCLPTRGNQKAGVGHVFTLSNNFLYASRRFGGCGKKEI